MASGIPRRGGGALQVARRWRWLLIGAVGLAFWIVFLVLSAVFGLGKMAPTVLLLGSFVVPVTIVVWNLDHLADPTLSGERVVYAFMGGGLLGLVLARPLNSLLFPPMETVAGHWGLLTIGLTEETAKLVGLVVASIGVARYSTRNGVVLGSAVGFGFAAMETAGYLFEALPEAGLWRGLVTNAIARGVLAPVGHGLFTAVIGAALFHAAGRRGRPRITWYVVAAFLWVALLHGLWDVIVSAPIPPPAMLGYMAAVAVAGVATLLAMWRLWVRKGSDGAAPSR